MGYQTCLPPPALRPYIDAYWAVVRGKVLARRARILPDGCLDILLHLASPAPGVTGQPPAGQLHLIGTLTRPVEEQHHCPMTAFGVRFRPAGLARFVAEPLLHTQDTLVELAAFAPAFTRLLVGQGVSDAPTFAAWCETVSRVLLGQLSRVPEPAPRLWLAVQQLQATAGQLSVGQAASLACLSERQFERRFASLVGVSPKELAGLLRFRAACEHLRAVPTAPLAAVALATGYYDAAHLARAFRRYAGQTPAQYRQ